MSLLVRIKIAVWFERIALWLLCGCWYGCWIVWLLDETVVVVLLEVWFLDDTGVLGGGFE